MVCKKEKFTNLRYQIKFIIYREREKTMKKRIISFILVVVMVALSLTSCGYSLAEEDLTQYASFNSEAFAEIFKSVEVEDGDFTSDEAIRVKKVEDSIYQLLISAAGSTTLTDGDVDENDVLTYCYYATVVKDGETVVVSASTMNSKNSVKAEFGYTDLKELSALNKAIKEEIVKIPDIKGYIYATKTSGTIANGNTAYISYTSTVVGSENNTKYTNVKVTVGADNGIHQPVVDKLLLSEAKIGTAIDAFKNSDETLEYSNATVNWVVNEITDGDATKLPEAVKVEVTLTASSTFTGVDASEYKLAAGDKVTYYVYPVSYVAVEDFTAETTVATLLVSNLTKESLDCFAECEALINDYTAKKEAYNKANSEYEELKKKDDASEEDIAAKSSAAETAKGERDAALAALVAGAGAENIVTQYKADVYDSLLEAYNSEIKLNLAAAVWEAMEANVTVNDCPTKLIREMYEILYENHEYTFYTSEPEDTDDESPYKAHGGSFESYLAEKTNTQGQNHQAAKDVLWAEAKKIVAEMIVVYYVAGEYDQLVDKKAEKEFKKTAEYKTYEASHGELNALTAHQFDILMDYFLTEKTEGEETVKNESGVIQYEKFASVTLVKTEKK